MKRLLMVLAVALAVSGCKTSYVWTSTVPPEMRKVYVPTFRNDSSITELGSVVTRQVLREVQREGTFRVSSPDACALEIQGVIKSASSGYGFGDRKSGMRLNEMLLTVSAEVSVVDRRRGKVLVNNRPFSASASFVCGQDRLTGERDASGRAADDLSRQIVDMLTTVQW